MDVEKGLNMDALRAAQAAAKPFFDERRAIEAAECPERLNRLVEAGVTIKWAGGNCPVQIEGDVHGQPFYFRARGDSWSVGIGGEPVGSPNWEHEEDYGDWPDAGWMHLHEAYDFLLKAVALCRTAPATVDGEGAK